MEPLKRRDHPPILVLGDQGLGKSLLLEALFGTDESNSDFNRRQQAINSRITSMRNRTKKPIDRVPKTAAKRTGSKNRRAIRAFPRTYSSPADPSAPSFVTSLPSEVRNRIYDLVVAFSPGDLEIFSGLRTPIVAVRSKLALARGLLYSCRQIHYEAASTFYCQVKFVAMAWSGRDFFTEWCEQLGSHIHLLRKVTIDYTALAFELSGHHWDGRSKAFDVLPVLRLLWAESGAMLQVSMKPPFPSDGPTTFENTFRSIAYDDQLSLRRYSASVHLLAAVNMGQDGKSGVVIFASTSPELDVQRTFTSSNEGTLVTMEQHPRIRSLLDLPDLIYCVIISYAYPAGTELVTYPHATRLPPWTSSMFQINRKMRSDATEHAFRTSRFAFVLNFKGLQSKFDDLPLMWQSNIAMVEFKTKPWHSIYDVFRRANHFKLLLEFDVRSHTISLGNFRMNVIELLHATSRLPSFMIITVRLRASLKGDRIIGEHSFTINQLRLSVFIALSQIFEHEEYRAHARCSAIYINGRGHPVGYVFPVDGVIRKLSDRTGVFTNEEVALGRAEEYLRSLRYEPQPFLVKFLPKGCVMLGELWDRVGLMIWPVSDQPSDP
ncbi:hypothetical protein BKA58DRAFT_98501 [Alternaria rosae]|uniref:uncharacterized protein n=1 Tax=Alternaria rosae TaxID=1187941 RepID=UPI001E8CA56D|nr:uncharacterized protein BKA58DRAFT_98501 [Alternaria rosae]KAH6878599.1 hypothetical protein BKA58DRAFT_98501 [Alternaria rosae]